MMEPHATCAATTYPYVGMACALFCSEDECLWTWPRASAPGTHGGSWGNDQGYIYSFHVNYNIIYRKFLAMNTLSGSVSVKVSVSPSIIHCCSMVMLGNWSGFFVLNPILSGLAIFCKFGL